MKNILKHTWAVLEKPEKKRFSLLIFCDVLISLADIASLALLLWIIRFYIQPAGATGPGFLPGWLADNQSAWLIALFFLFFGVKNMLAWLVARAWNTFNGNVAVRISCRNLSVYQQSAFSEFIDTDSSVHIRRIGFQPFEFCQYILSGIPQIITQSFLILFTISAILVFNAGLFLVLLAVLLPPVVVIFYFIRSRLTNVKRSLKDSGEKSFRHLLDALKGYVESNIYGRHEFFLRRFAYARKKFSASLFESISIQSMPPRMIEVFAILGLVILVLIAKWSGNNNTDYLVTIGAFTGAAYKIIPGIVKIINLGGQVKAYEFSVEELIQNNTLPAPPQENKKICGLDAVQLKNISFCYAGLPVLRNLSFSVEKGDFLVITGESGKGKTTILNILLGFLKPGEGGICFNNSTAHDGNIAPYWPFIAYVKQDTFLIHDTILRNITLEEDGHHEKNLHEAIEVSGLRKLIDASPEKLDKMIMENGKNISGGQRQRIAIARALYKNADLLVLDEPFNELDEESETLLLQHLKKMAQSGKMVILITHNKKSLSFCNKQVSLDEAPKIPATGLTAEPQRFYVNSAE